MQSRLLRSVTALSVMLSLAVTATMPSFASRLRPVNLEEMTERADRIFLGRCVGVRVVWEPQLGLSVSEVTFAVDRSVKGGVPGRLTIRLLGEQGGETAAGRGIDGLPRFQEGEEVVLFLYGDSPRGLTSPVGFAQGKFKVAEDKEGQPVAVNGFGNTRLFRGLSLDASARLGERAEQARARRIVSRDGLLSMVESLLEASGPIPRPRQDP